LRALVKNAMHSTAMQIVCPNCSTAYEVPDQVFAGRARRLRCEQCGHQWRAGPPGSPPPAWPEFVVEGSDVFEAPNSHPQGGFSPPQDAAPAFEAPPEPPVLAEPPPAAAPEPEYVPEHVPESELQPQATGWYKDRSYMPAEVDDGSDDPFINLVQAARLRRLETEPEPLPQPSLRTSNPVFFGALVVLFVVAFLVMEFQPLSRWL